MNPSSKIKYQISSLPPEFLKNQNSEEIIRVIITSSSGVYEDIRVVDDGLTLECTMEWNEGSYYYDIPVKELSSILSTKAFNEISSEDLIDFEWELLETKTGYLVPNHLNGVSFDDTDEILKELAGSKYEISDESEDILDEVISDHMQDLYSGGDIVDVEIRFFSLLSLEFQSEVFGNFSITNQFHLNELSLAKTALKNKDYQSSIIHSNNFLEYEINCELEDYLNSLENASNISSDIKSTLKIYSEAYENLGDYAKSLEYHSYLITIEPESDFHHAHAGFCYTKLEEWNDAVKELNIAIELNDKYVWARTILSEALIKLEKTDTALEIIEKGLINHPGADFNHWLYQRKGEIYYAQNDWSNASIAYEEANKIEGKNPYYHWRLAYCYFHLDKYQDSFNSFTSCINLDEQYKDAYTFYHMGESMRCTKNYTAGIDYLLQTLELNNSGINPYASLSLGLCYLNVGEYNKAINSLKNANSDTWTKFNIGKAYYHTGELHKALDEFNNVLVEDPKYKWGIQWKADTLFQLEEFDESLDEYNKLISIDENFPTYDGCGYIYMNMALLHQYSGDFENANKYYNLAEDYDSSNKKYLWRYYFAALSAESKKGLLFSNPLKIKGLSDETIISGGDKTVLVKACLNRARQIHRYSEGENMGKYNPNINISDINLILEQEPNNYIAMFQKARIISGDLMSIENLNENDKELINVSDALEILNEVIKINLYQPAFSLLFKLETNLEKIHMAINAGKQEFENNASWWSNVGKKLLELKDLSAAKEAMEKAINLNSESSFYYETLGNIYLELEDNELALKSFKRAISISEYNPEFKLGAAKANLKLGSIDIAEQQIKSAINDLYAREKEYYIIYSQIIGEKYKEIKYLKNILIEYTQETRPYEARNTEVKTRIRKYLEKCNKYGAKEAILFQFWEFFLDVDLEFYLEKGSYNTKYYLSKNKSLNKKQLDLLVKHGSHTILENVIANPNFSLDDLNEIVKHDDKSYNYSYKLLGVLANPNCSPEIIEELKSSDFNWVRSRAYSKTEEYHNEDLNNKYNVLGLLQNDRVSEKEKQKLQQSLSSLNSDYYIIKFADTERESLQEYLLTELEFNNAISKITESFNSGDRDWEKYVGEEWHTYGDSEYGLSNPELNYTIHYNSKEERNVISFDVKQLDVKERSYEVDTFIFQAESYESGSFKFDELQLEFVFRPEFLSLNTTDLGNLIHGLEYFNPQTEEEYYSEGTLENSRTIAVNIELYFQAENEGLIEVDYDRILLDLERDDYDSSLDFTNIDEETMRNYFALL